MSKTKAHDYAGLQRRGSVFDGIRLAADLTACEAAAQPKNASGCPDATSGHPASRSGFPGGWSAEDDFATQYRLAMEGEPSSARRVAELYEYYDQIELARYWWNKSATLGDRDAILYVESTLLG